MIDFERALATTILSERHRALISDILSAALEAADPLRCTEKNLALAGNTLVVGGNPYPLDPESRLVLVSLGKAAPAMTQGAINRLNYRYSHGVCVGKHLPQDDPGWKHIELIHGNHPVPGAESINAGQRIKEAVGGLGPNDLVLLLLSGGGSSLAMLPAEGIGVEDLSILTATLLRSGANIDEMNSVRKHVDLLKGGGLLRLASPTRLAALVLSDVVGNKLDVIASGPAYPDPSSYADALAIITKAAGCGNIPDAILAHLCKGAAGGLPETLKPQDGIALNAFHRIIASNVDSCQAAAARANQAGCSAEVVTTALTGEASLVGAQIAAAARTQMDLDRPFVFIWGGETTVTVAGNGTGGRNLEAALGAVEGMAGLRGMYLVTLATDGEDGPTGTAGAVVTGDTLNKALKLGLEPSSYLGENDSYTFFKKTGNLLVTGPTGTNVNDITFLFGF